LETYTQYLVSLQVFNPEGPGPNTTVLVMTDEGGEYERHASLTFSFSQTSTSSKDDSFTLTHFSASLFCLHIIFDGNL
jgi:hypothetical protein